MNEPKVAITVFCAALLIPGSRDIAAQLASKLEAGQYTVNNGILPISAIRFAPTVRFELPYADTDRAQLGICLGAIASVGRRHRVRHVHVAHRVRRARRNDRQREPRD